MGVLWMRARAQLRGQARANLFLVLLIGLAGALVLAAAAGARRSEAALPRFLAANRTMDAAVFLPTADPTDDLAEARRQVAALPEVRQVFRESGRVGALILAGADPADPARWHRQLGTVALDPGGAVFGRPIVVAGRLPDEGRAEEVAVDEELAERRRLRVGSRYRVAAFTLQQLGPAGEGRALTPRGAVADQLVVGIVRYPKDLLPVVDDAGQSLRQQRRPLPDPGLLATLRARHRQVPDRPGRGPPRRAGRPAGAEREPAPPVRAPGRGGVDGRVGRGRGDHDRDPAGHRAGVGRAGRLRPAGRRGRHDAGGPDARTSDPHGGGRVPGPAGAWHDPGPADRDGGGPGGPARRSRVSAGRRRRGRAVARDPAGGGATSGAGPRSRRRPAGAGRRGGGRGRRGPGVRRPGRLARRA